VAVKIKLNAASQRQILPAQKLEPSESNAVFMTFAKQWLLQTHDRIN
jgi:hypothetical protein